MKIGITTFQRAHNFGAQMQMYALYTFLKKQGHDVWILDYYCSPVEHSYLQESFYWRRYISKNPFRGICRFFKELYGHFTYQRRKVNSFLGFLMDNFKLTERFDRAECLPVDFDVMITGSDQLWNYHITHGRKEVYFLDNKQNTENMPRRISYAVSVEKDNFHELVEDIDYINKMLSSFNWVSVREQPLAELLRTRIGVNADVAVDPSLFMKVEDCLKIAVKPKEEHFLCVYRVSHTSYLEKLSKKISKERGLKIVRVYASERAVSKAESYGPREILGFLCYSDAVLTSSFHGTVFSIINKKDFYSAYDFKSVRVYSLLKTLGLTDRMLKSFNDYQNFEKIDYNKVNFESLVVESQSMLLKYL